LYNVNFKNISQMEDFYNSILDEDVTIKKTVKELTKEYNDKLNYLIDNEMYEEAAKMRDYMSGNNIKRISKKK
jgi:protein-arginine kinase activator protein McsA